MIQCLIVVTVTEYAWNWLKMLETGCQFSNKVTKPQVTWDNGGMSKLYLMK